MFCTECGNELSSDARFCESCGAVNEDAVGAPPAAEPPVASRPGAPRAEAAPVGAVPGPAEPVARAAPRRRLLLPAIAGVVLVLAACSGAYAYVNHRATQKVEELRARMKEQVDFEYGSVHTNPFTMSVTVGDLKVTALDGKPVEGITIREVTVRGGSIRGDVPKELGVEIDDLTLDTARMGAEARSLAELGFPQLVFDAALDYRYSPDTREFDLNRLRFAGQDIFAIEASLHLADLPPQQEFAANGLSRTTTLRSAELVLSDFVIIDRIAGIVAAKQEMPPEQLKDLFLAGVDQVLADAPSEFRRNASTALGKLVREPGSRVKLTFAPENPVTFAAIGDASSMRRRLQLLNISITN